MRLFQVTALLVAALNLASGASLEEVLGKMDGAAPRFSSMTASLSRVTFTKVLDEKTTEAGSIKLRKLGKELQVYIDIVKPDPKIVSFRGRRAEIYLPRLKTVQEYDLGKQGSLIDQFLLVGFGTSGRELKTNYAVKLLGEETVGGQKTWHLQMIPLSGALKQRFRSLELWIDETTIYPVQQQFIDPSGDYYLFTYTDVKVNPALTEDALKMRVPKGTKRETPQR